MEVAPTSVRDSNLGGMSNEGVIIGQSTEVLNSMPVETPITASMDGGSSTVFASGSDLPDNSNPKTECSKKILNIRQNMSNIRLKATKALIEVLNISSSLTSVLPQLITSVNWKDANASEEVLALLEVIEGHGESILTETDALWTRSQYLKEADEYLRTNFGGSDNPKKYPDLKILHQVVRIDNQTKTTTSLGPPSESELTKTSEISEQDKATEELKNKCKMFPKVPKGLVTLQTGKVELMRLSAAYELFQTEVDYNQDLSIMLHYLKAQFITKGIRGEDVNQVFSNIEEVVSVNKFILSRLVSFKDSNPLLENIGDALLETVDSFRLYSIYCGNYPRAMKKISQLNLNEDFKSFLKSLMVGKEAKGLSFESFLIKPVQRICKYPLLVKELARHTDEQSAEGQRLALAAERFEAVLAIINNVTRHIESRERNVEILSKIESPIDIPLVESTRLRDGPVYLVNGTRLKDRYAFLFMDALLICKVSKTGYILESGYLIGELEMRNDNLADNARPGVKNTIQLFVISENLASLSLSFQTQERKLEWIESFNRSFKAFFDGKSSHKVTEALDVLEKDLQSFRSRSLKDRVSQRASLSPARKRLEFNLSSMAELEEIKGLTNPSVCTEEPEIIIIEGAVWKKAVAATGQIYYYKPGTRETIWGLPDIFELPMTDVELRKEEYGFNDLEVEEDPHVELEVVEGQPDWRRVSADDSIYYFNVATRESAWSLDETTTDRSEQ